MMNEHKTLPILTLGFKFVVYWENGHGYDLYEIIRNPFGGAHLVEEIASYEVCADGSYSKVEL